MQVMIPLYFHCTHMPDQAELQQAILGIVCQPDGPSDAIFEGLREVFPNAGWTDGELGTCEADKSRAQWLADLLGHAYGTERFPYFLVKHLGFTGEDVALEDIIRRSGARLDHAYRDATGLAPWTFSDRSALILQPEGGWYLRAPGCAAHCCGTCSCDGSGDA